MSFWTDEQIEFIKLNWQQLTHKQMADAIGKSERGVRTKCWRLGFVVDVQIAPDKIQRIKDWYESRKGGKLELNVLSSELDMNRSVVCRVANRLGLTDVHRTWHVPPRVYATREELREAMSKRAKEMLELRGHPRGMLGKKHSKDSREAMSRKSLDAAARRPPQKQAEMTKKAMATKLQKYGTLIPKAIRNGSAYSNARGGIRDDLGMYFRSAWEANYARYLNWLIGKRELLRWEFEPDEFAFPVKKGCRFYLPDFKVFELDGTFSYHEIKGWMDQRSKTKLKRMAKYHPDVKIVLIDQKSYNAIERLLSKTIPNWEFKGEARIKPK